MEVSSSRDRVYIYLLPGAIINGREVQPHGPQFMMSISSIESFENKLKSAQDDIGIPHESRIPISYQSLSENLLVGVDMLVAKFQFG